MPSSLSPNCDARPAGTPIDTLVLHYTGMRSAAAARDRLCDPASRVSAHYVIDEDGLVSTLVPEERRAWHAGVSCWRGHRDINGRSVGIELVNPGHEFGYRAFPEKQIDALTELSRQILGRHPIPARNVVGHSDVAPARKLDPGELFPWKRLAGVGIGLWLPADVGAAKSKAHDVTRLLGEYGYDTEVDTAILLRAFQRHFRPEKTDGVADDETAARLVALIERLGVEGRGGGL